jgi:hypothetical protein
MDNYEIVFKSTFYSKPKKLVFTKESLNLYKGSVLLKTINKSAIRGIKYGIKWIDGSHLIIGRAYSVYVSDLKSNIIPIKLSSVYGVNKHKLGVKYNEIIDKLFEFYFNELIYEYLIDIENGQEIEIANVVFRRDGVLLDKKIPDGFLSWEEIDSRVYSRYYALLSNKKPEFYKVFTYLTDWNAVLVYYISRKMLIRKGLFLEKD